MKTVGKLFLLLSFIVIGRWSRPNPPVIVATFSKLIAPAGHRAPNTSQVVLVRRTEPAGSQRRAATSSMLVLF